MTAIRFAHPAAFVLLLVGPALAALFRYGDARRRSALALFGARTAANRKRTVKRALTVAAAVLLALAIARPVDRNLEPPSSSGDVVFVLDVSRSMFSRDAPPNRLRRAKQIAGDIAAQIASQPGSRRLGLIAFAGNASVLCPLTIDADYFRQMLDDASSDSVSRGGSRIGDALRFARENGFDDIRRGSKDLILLTDGGDQDSNPQEAAQSLARAGIRLSIIGVGDPEHSIDVPMAEDNPLPFFYDGAPVTTKLESAELRAIGGAYAEANDGAFSPAAIVRRLAARPQASAGDTQQEYYPVLLAIAVLLLMVECLIPERVALRTVAAALALAACVAPARAQSATEWIKQGNDAFAIQQYDSAVTWYRRAASILPASPQLQFDIGVAAYRSGAYSMAAQAFAVAADRAHDSGLASKSLLGEGNAYFRNSDARGLEGNTTDAIRSLERAVDLYTGALAADPTSKDAAYNLAIAKKKLDDMKRKRRLEAAQDYQAATMRHDKPATADPNEILKEGKRKTDKQQAPRHTVATDW